MTHLKHHRLALEFLARGFGIALMVLLFGVAQSAPAQTKLVTSISNSAVHGSAPEI
jgi:hypothetical protein